MNPDEEVDPMNYARVMTYLISGEAGRSDLPADVFTYIESLQPWEALARFIEGFQFMMELRAGKPGSLRMPFGQTPTENIDKQCDAWIIEFIAAKNRRKMVPPPWLLKWLAVRAFAANLGIQFEQDEGTPPPDKDDLEGELKMRLVDMWHSDMKEIWPKIDPAKGDPNYKGD